MKRRLLSLAAQKGAEFGPVWLGTLFIAWNHRQRPLVHGVRLPVEFLINPEYIQPPGVCSCKVTMSFRQRHSHYNSASAEYG